METRSEERVISSRFALRFVRVLASMETRSEERVIRAVLYAEHKVVRVASMETRSEERVIPTNRARVAPCHGSRFNGDAL